MILILGNEMPILTMLNNEGLLSFYSINSNSNSNIRSERLNSQDPVINHQRKTAEPQGTYNSHPFSYFKRITENEMKKPRYLLYLKIANDENVDSLAENLYREFEAIANNFKFSIRHGELPTKDFLMSLINIHTSFRISEAEKENSIDTPKGTVKNLVPLMFVGPEITETEESKLIGIKAFKRDVKKVKFQRIIHLTSASSESSMSESFDDEVDEPAAKRPKIPKIWQLAQIFGEDYYQALKLHSRNEVILDGVTRLQTDIMIYIPKKVTFVKNLASYLGLIFAEDLYAEISFKQDFATRFESELKNKTAKSWRLLQKLYCEKLLFGTSNICVTQNDTIFKNSDSNFKCVVNQEFGDCSPVKILENKLFLDELARSANFSITLPPDANFLQYIEVISEVLEEAIGVKAHVVTYYCYEETIQRVKMPLTPVLPVYVLRHLANVHFAKISKLNRFEFRS